MHATARTLLSLALPILLAPAARTQAITTEGAMNPNGERIDFESFAIGPISSPLKLGNATFAAGPGLGIASVANWGADGTEVAGNTLIPFASGALPESGYSPITITFQQPVREFGMGWFDPNGAGNRLLALDGSGALLAEITPELVPTGGCCASFVGLTWHSDAIATVIVVPHGKNDWFAIDNVRFYRGGDVPMNYCAAKPSSSGCLASMGTSAPTAQPVSGAKDYFVIASQVEAHRNGMFVWSMSGPGATPYAGALLCVSTPLGRTPVTSSGGGPACSGGLGLLVNGGAPWDAGPGMSVWMQAFYRDPILADPYGLALSDAIQIDFR